MSEMLVTVYWRTKTDLLPQELEDWLENNTPVNIDAIDYAFVVDFEPPAKWEDAPLDATWLTVSRDGYAEWWRKKPNYALGEWYANEEDNLGAEYAGDFDMGDAPTKLCIWERPQ